jgi:hypothetical protein
MTGGPGERGADCYLMARPLPFALPFAAPADVILLVFMSSPIYLCLLGPMAWLLDGRRTIVETCCRLPASRVPT